MAERLFGTDGVRGIANEKLSPLLAYNLGRAGAHILSELNQKPVIVVGKDTRISGDMLESAIISGICSVGADVIKVGIMPTPAVAYLTRYFKADAGVVISASHNPMEYNGIKFFNKDGFKLPDQLEDQIEALVNKPVRDIRSPIGEDIGRVYIKDGIRPYVDFVKSIFKLDLRDMKIAIDCANGASCVTAPVALSQLGAKIYVINDKYDGCNINVECGSTHPEAISSFTKEVGADIGLSFDGDADRLIAVDENGELVDGDHIMAICGTYLNNNGLLRNSTVVSTIMSNMGLEASLKKAGVKMVRTKVGDRYVLEEMINNDYNLGGEQSGHIIFFDHNSTGDGLITAVNLLNVMIDEGKPLSELKKIMTVFPQLIINVKVKDKYKYNENKNIQSAVRKSEKRLSDRGRVVVRPSGTEPLIRIMVEGEDRQEANKVAAELAELIEKELS
jgi:phosphoglucosamine mutase